MADVIQMFQSLKSIAVCPDCWGSTWLVVLDEDGLICGFICDACAAMWEPFEDEEYENIS